MPLILAQNLPLTLAILFLIGVAIGSLVNWAIYRLAWFPREISPWGPAPSAAPPRRWSDRIPLLGWWGLRRESALHGRLFWIRPLAIELAMGAGFVALYWWEVIQQAPILAQINDLLPAQIALAPGAVSDAWTHAIFLNHLLLIALMVAASFIDIDEKIIPDGITVPGTLLGLLVATVLPMSLLPHVDLRDAPPMLGEVVALPPMIADALRPGEQIYVEPVTLAAPNPWPKSLDGAPAWRSLAIAQACWWLWCFAIAPRIWRGRRGALWAIWMIARRITRELARPPLAVFAWPGSLAIAALWWYGGPSWTGLLTSLVGLAVSGGLVWIVRIVGTMALRREAMGFGDVTLMMMVGTFVGWQAGVLIFFIAPFAGMIVGVVQAITRRDDVIPYGPFLCLGTLFVMVRWADVWNQSQYAFEVDWLVPSVLLASFAMLGLMLAVWLKIKTALFGKP